MKILIRDIVILIGVALFVWVVIGDLSILLALGGGICLGLSFYGVYVVVRDLYRYLKTSRRTSPNPD